MDMYWRKQLTEKRHFLPSLDVWRFKERNPQSLMNCVLIGLCCPIVQIWLKFLLKTKAVRQNNSLSDSNGHSNGDLIIRNIAALSNSKLKLNVRLIWLESRILDYLILCCDTTKLKYDTSSLPRIYLLLV